MIGRHSRRTQQCEVLQVARCLAHRSVNKIVYNHLRTRFAGHAEAQHESFARVGPAIAFLPGKLAHPRIVEPSFA